MGGREGGVWGGGCCVCVGGGVCVCGGVVCVCGWGGGGDFSTVQTMYN